MKYFNRLIVEMSDMKNSKILVTDTNGIIGSYLEIKSNKTNRLFFLIAVKIGPDFSGERF